jgi:hypothetical protein
MISLCAASRVSFTRQVAAVLLPGMLKACDRVSSDYPSRSQEYAQKFPDNQARSAAGRCVMILGCSLRRDTVDLEGMSVRVGRTHLALLTWVD